MWPETIGNPFLDAEISPVGAELASVLECHGNEWLWQGALLLATAHPWAAAARSGRKTGRTGEGANDRPGVLAHVYVFSVGTAPFLLLSYGVHFVHDPTAPIGAASPIEAAKGKGGVAASRAPEGITGAPAGPSSGVSDKKPETTGARVPATRPAKAPPATVGEIK